MSVFDKIETGLKEAIAHEQGSIHAKTTKMHQLLGADGKLYSSERPGTLGGNSKQKIYGKLDCPMALSTIRRFPGIYEQSRVFFANEKTALAAGYRPCGSCLREKYRE